MKFERLSDTEVRALLQEARALRNEYLKQLALEGAKKLRVAVRGLWHGARHASPALVTPAARRRAVDIDQFVVR
jgi:hypothetical protein